MELSKKTPKNVGFAIEIRYYHTNMNLLAFHVVITLTNGSMISLNYNGKNIFMNRIRYAEIQIFSSCVDAYKIFEGNDYDKLYDVLSTLKNKKLKRKNNILILNSNKTNIH